MWSSSSQVHDCGLSSSVYQRCYPESLARKASLCSIQTLDGNSENNPMWRRDSCHQWYPSGACQGCSTAECQAWNEPRDHDQVGCCLEEECAYGLIHLLTEKLEKQAQHLFGTLYGRDLKPLGLRNTLEIAAGHILHLSEDEPYGIRGAKLILKFKSHKGDERTLGVIAMDSATVSTFELVLVLQEERQLGVSLRNWLGQITGAAQALLLSQHYSLKKRRLYRNSNTVTFQV